MLRLSSKDKNYSLKKKSKSYRLCKKSFRISLITDLYKNV